MLCGLHHCLRKSSLPREKSKEKIELQKANIVYEQGYNIDYDIVQAGSQQRAH